MKLQIGDKVNIAENVCVIIRVRLEGPNQTRVYDIDVAGDVIPFTEDELASSNLHFAKDPELGSYREFTNNAGTTLTQRIQSHIRLTLGRKPDPVNGALNRAMFVEQTHFAVTYLTRAEIIREDDAMAIRNTLYTFS